MTAPADPGVARCGEGAGRLAGLDLARGVAVVSMLVAVLRPVGGPLTVTEYLTAPLFAVVIGTSMGVRLARTRPAAGVFVLDNLVRGLLLVALGVALQATSHQVDVVLPYLGLLVIVLAPLAVALWRAPVLTLGLGVAGAVISPLVMERAREYLADTAGRLGEARTTVVEWVAAGESYRLTSLLPMALGGLALAVVLPRAGERPHGYGVVAVLWGSSLAAYLVGWTSRDGAAAYSGTTAEIVGATLLATGTVVAAFVVSDLALDRRAEVALEPLLATGRLALTAYTLQVLLLAAVEVARGGESTGGWAILGLLLVVVPGTCWALDRWWGTGPLEWVLHRLRPRARRPAHVER